MERDRARSARGRGITLITGAASGIAACAFGQGVPLDVRCTPTPTAVGAREAGRDVTPLLRRDQLLHDNGEPDGTDGYGNNTFEVTGCGRHSLLDDFVVPVGSTWTIQALEHYALWNFRPVGSGESMQIEFRIDDKGTPGAIIAVPTVTSYTEEATGRILFEREEYIAWTTFTDVELDAGKYWFQANVIGGDDFNFWLVHRFVTFEECWVHFECTTGLVPGSSYFDDPADLAWRLHGEGGDPCPVDLNDSGAVDFGDIVAILAAWGSAGVPEDLDRNGTVDFQDILIVLGQWGPCFSGACCFDNGTCLEDQVEADCLAAGGAYQGDDVTCLEACPTGACCLPAGCLITSAAECIGMGGQYQGHGSTCASACNITADDCADALTRSGGSHFYSTVGATTDGDVLPPACAEGDGDFVRDVWLRYVAPCPGTATISICASDFDTRLAIYEDRDAETCPGAFVACNDDACGDEGNRSTVSFPVNADAAYMIRIGSRDGSVGSGTLAITCGF